MGETLVVVLVVGVMTFFAGRTIYRNLRGKNRGCGCGGGGSCATGVAGAVPPAADTGPCPSGQKR